MFWQFINHWWNIPFLVLLGLAVVFVLLQVVGIIGHDHDSDGPELHGPDMDGPDIDGPDTDGPELEKELDGGHMTAPWHEAFAFLGVGRVPFSVIWMTLSVFAGFSGLFVNRVMYAQRGESYPSWFFPIALLSSFIVGLIGVRLFSRVAGRFVDIGGKGSTAKHELSGHIGTVASAQLDDQFGEVRTHDDSGNELLVHGRLEKNEPHLLRGAKVVLIEFEAEKGFFWVTASPDVDAAHVIERKA